MHVGFLLDRSLGEQGLVNEGLVRDRVQGSGLREISPP